ncbi:hypothetical protein LCGC14_2671820, partial [marine sediment metagenome]
RIAALTKTTGMSRPEIIRQAIRFALDAAKGKS